MEKSTTKIEEDKYLSKISKEDFDDLGFDSDMEIRKQFF
jgi:hypothetical protein